jgi:hypothetical protein
MRKWLCCDAVLSLGGLGLWQLVVAIAAAAAAAMLCGWACELSIAPV